jgi:DNA-binding transcriptional MerR regulator
MDKTYTIDALLAEGFTLRAIRKYQTLGIIPKACGGRGNSAFYNDNHLWAARRIKELKDANRTLEELAEACFYDRPWLYPERKHIYAVSDEDESATSREEAPRERSVHLAGGV